MSKFIDLSNKKFGRLYVVKRVENRIQPNGSIKSQWLCECDCGNKIVVCGSNIKNGHTKSCGCIDYERKVKHGMSGKKLYKLFYGIKSRCFYKKNKQYKDYGGRGIKICEDWMNNFKSFCDWAIENGYKDGLTIDRIDVNGDYCPENCRFVNNYIQSRNRRNNVFMSMYGKTLCLTDWCKLLKIPKETARYHFYKKDFGYFENKYNNMKGV